MSPCIGNHKEEMMGKFPKYDVESALRSLRRTQELKGDPEMMKQVKKLLKKSQKQYSGTLILL